MKYISFLEVWVFLNLVSLLNMFHLFCAILNIWNTIITTVFMFLSSNPIICSFWVSFYQMFYISLSGLDFSVCFCGRFFIYNNSILYCSNSTVTPFRFPDLIRVCVCLPPPPHTHHQTILKHQQGVQELCSDMICPETTAPNSQVKDSVLQDCPLLPTPDTCQAPGSYLPSTDWRLPWPRP